MFVYVYVTVTNGFVTNQDTGYFIYLLIAEIIIPNVDPKFSGGLSSVLSFDLNETNSDVIKYNLPSVFDSNSDDKIIVYINGKLPNFATLKKVSMTDYYIEID